MNQLGQESSDQGDRPGADSGGRRRLGIPLVVIGLLAVIVAAWSFSRPEPATRLPVIDLENAYPDVADSIRIARKSVQQQPQSSKAWGRLGMILLACGYGSESTVVFAEAERLDPTDSRWPYLQGTTLEGIEPIRAIACIGRAIDAEPDRVLFHLRLAEVFISIGKLDEAKEPLEIARSLEPDNPRTQLAWARWEYRQDHLEKSLAYATRAAELQPNTRTTHELLARIHHRLDQPAAAAEQLELVRRLPEQSVIFSDPITYEVSMLRRDPGPAIQHAQVLLMQQRPDAAIRVLRRLVGQDPAVLPAQVELWRALVQAGRIAESEAALQAALVHHPASPQLLLLRGIELFDDEKWNEAMGWFERSIAHQADNAAAHFHLGLCQARRDDRTAAIESLRTAVAFEPDHARAHTALGKLLLQNKALPAAVEHLRTAVKFAPGDPEPRKLLEEAEQAHNRN